MSGGDVLLSLLLSAVVQPPRASVNDAAWLAGCWETTTNGRVVEEQWTRPRGGTMLGVGRTTMGDRTLDHEFVILAVNEEGRLAYEAHPDGQQTTTFLATEVGARRLVFEDPSHDFPQQVGYEQTADHQLTAWISGRTNGRERRIPFVYHRVACPPAVTP